MTGTTNACGRAGVSLGWLAMRRWFGATATATVAAMVVVLALTVATASAGPLYEKDVNLDESVRLADALRSRGLEVTLTRTADVNPDLVTRARRGAGADLLVSVHNNGSTDRNRRGSEVYAQVASSTSQAVARRILDGMVARAGTVRRGVFTRPGEHGDYYSVLRNSPVPAVIVEGAYLSNAEDARLLAQPAFRQRLADGIADGVVAHFVTASPQGPGPPPARQGVGSMSAPAGLVASRIATGAYRLTWAPVLAASGYEVWRDGNRVALVPTTQFDDSGLRFGGHHYEVRAVLDVAGLRVLESPSATVDVAAGRVVIDPGHGGEDPGAVGSI